MATMVPPFLWCLVYSHDHGDTIYGDTLWIYCMYIYIYRQDILVYTFLFLPWNFPSQQKPRAIQVSESGHRNAWQTSCPSRWHHRSWDPWSAPPWRGIQSWEPIRLANRCQCRGKCKQIHQLQINMFVTYVFMRTYMCAHIHIYIHTHIWIQYTHALTSFPETQPYIPIDSLT